MWSWTFILGCIKALPPSFWQWLRADLFRTAFLVLCLALVYQYIALQDRAETAMREARQIVMDCANEVKLLKRQVVTYEGCRTGSPYGDPPIRVTFADGVVAYVNFSRQIRPIDPQACTSGSYYFPGDGIVWEPVESEGPLPPENCKMFRLPAGPAAAFANMTLATVISELELLTFDTARRDRKGISERVREQVSRRFLEHGVKLEALHLLEFCVATDVGGVLPTDPEIPRFGLDW